MAGLFLRFRSSFQSKWLRAGVAELVDAQALGACFYGSGSSSLPARTIFGPELDDHRHDNSTVWVLGTGQGLGFLITPARFSNFRRTTFSDVPEGSVFSGTLCRFWKQD